MRHKRARSSPSRSAKTMRGRQCVWLKREFENKARVRLSLIDLSEKNSKCTICSGKHAAPSEATPRIDRASVLSSVCRAGNRKSSVRPRAKGGVFVQADPGRRPLHRGGARKVLESSSRNRGRRCLFWRVSLVTFRVREHTNAGLFTDLKFAECQPNTECREMANICRKHRRTRWVKSKKSVGRESLRNIRLTD